MSEKVGKRSKIKCWSAEKKKSFVRVNVWEGARLIIHPHPPSCLHCGPIEILQFPSLLPSGYYNFPPSIVLWHIISRLSVEGEFNWRIKGAFWTPHLQCDAEQDGSVVVRSIQGKVVTMNQGWRQLDFNQRRMREILRQVGKISRFRKFCNSFGEIWVFRLIVSTYAGQIGVTHPWISSPNLPSAPKSIKITFSSVRFVSDAPCLNGGLVDWRTFFQPLSHRRCRWMFTHLFFADKPSTVQLGVSAFPLSSLQGCSTVQYVSMNVC